jgi:hypothetical protein
MLHAILLHWQEMQKTLADLGYKLDHIEAFDLFPMTQHIECVAGFSPANR